MHMTTDPTIETPEQAVERLRQHRALIALEEAPELLRHVRSQIAASDGRPEAGEVYRPMSSPLRLSPTDDSDAVFGWIVFWAQTWSKRLGVKLPTSAVLTYAGDDAIPLGFRAGVTPEQAHDDTRMVARWLTARFEAIAADADGADFFDVVQGAVRDLRGRYPMEPGKERLTSDRVCPVCATKAVRAIWHSADLLDVSIECTACTEAFVAKRGTIESALGESVCSHVIPPPGEFTPLERRGRCERCDELVLERVGRWLR